MQRCNPPESKTPPKTPVYKRLGFQTASGMIWFEFSPQKLKEYFLELWGLYNTKDMVDDIAFSTVFDMSLLKEDEPEGQQAFGLNLCTVVDGRAKVEARFLMLKEVCGTSLKDPSLDSLRSEVDKLMDVDLVKAGIEVKPGCDLFAKSSLITSHHALKIITRHARTPKSEFCIYLFKLFHGQGGTMQKVTLYFSYATSLGTFLLILRDRTSLYTDGFTLQDGPWLYRLTKCGKVEKEWCYLTDDTSFRDMLYKLRRAGGVAAMMHSVESAIEDQHCKEMKKEENDNEDIKDMMGLPFFKLHSQLTFKTSSTKKRKICEDTVTDFDNNPEVPLDSIEEQETPQYASYLPRFDFSTAFDSQPSLPPHLPSHLQNEASLSTQDYISSAASSPSAAYAGLSIESERGGDMSGSEGGAGTGNTDSQDTRSQSPNRSFAHRAIMGGAADFPQRSSSPLKRPASDLESETTVTREDVDMETLPSSDPPEESVKLGLVAKEEEQSRGSPSAVQVPGTANSSINNLAEATSALESGNSMSTPTKNQIPSIDEQIKVVMQILETHAASKLRPGEKAYVISKKWLSRVQARGSAAKVSNKEDLEGEIGPIDNSDILQEILQDGDGENFVRLKPDLARFSFEYFPEDAWEYVMKCYGLKAGQLPILRKAVNTNPDGNGEPNVEYELHPPVFVVHRLWAANSPIPLPQVMKARKPNAPVFVVSRGDSYMEFLKRIKHASSIELSRKVQVWKLPRTLGAVESIAASIANEASPPPSRGNTPAPESQPRPQDSWRQLLVDVASFLELERGTQRELVQVPDQSNNANYNGHMTVQMADLGVDQALVLDEFVETDYLSKYVSKVSHSVPVTRSGISQGKSANNSGRSSPVPSGPMTRGRAQKSGRTIGTVGLSNLGNTCYMNSALQCVRSVEELTKYFLTHQAEKEVNRENPLGNNGEVALAYNALLEEIYRDPPPTSVVPRYFKNTIGKYAPSFSGYGQQDSQEFLGFLLDGLQEDLSRVKKKPYIEKPDSTDEMVGNPVAIREMAAKVWDITKKRDDSVIADLFTGMYKSTLVCPVCAKVSITFDPFNNLTLQLPIENAWSHDVFYFPLNDRPIRISVDMDKQGSIKALKEFISARVDVPVERLFIAEEWKCRFYKFYDDLKPVSEEIQTNDQVAVYELEAVPTNWPPQKKPAKQKVKSMLSFSNFNDSDDNDDVPNWDDPMAERMLVPVLHRQPSPDTSARYRKPWAHAPVPHFIIVTAAEARSEEAIRRKILEKVATLTTHPAFSQDEKDTEDEEEDANDNVDLDLVVTTASDADSSGDSKVVATSVDGEDELVDVTMNDSNVVRKSIERSEVGASNPGSTHNSDLNSRKQKFHSHRPKWVNPNEFLQDDFRNLFELSFFTGSKELVPVGWGSVDEDKEYPRLSSRDPQVMQSMEEDDRPQEDYSMTNGRTHSDDSSDGEEDDAPHLVAPTRMNDEESSDEDELAPTSNITRALPVRPIAQRTGARVGYTRHRNAGIRTYSKKGTKLAISQQQRQRDDAEDAPDDGPLIRLGEGIVVDWYSETHEAIYCGDENDPMRGRPTYSHIELMEDPQLEAKRKARMHRKKKGLTLEECLDEFGKEEILSEMDTWYCPRCKEHRRASKKFELWKTPDILVMHLKRFSSNAMRRDKLDVFVDFPIDNLDLTSRVVEQEDGKEEMYDLFAVDDHWGGLGGGHYTAFAKSFIDHKWYEYNDSSVSEQKDTSRIISAGAYLLFYRRRSSVPLGGPRFKEIVDRYNNPPESSEDETESGEDQRLVADSSLHGSSSALIGAGAAHLAAGGLGGVVMTRTANQLASGGVALQNQRTINPADLDKPPAYQAELDDDDTVPLMAGDAVMNDRLEVQVDMEDEAIDMNMGYSNLNASRNTSIILSNSWNFANIANLQTGSSTIADPSGGNSDFDIGEIDDGSDVVQHNSSASERELAERLEDFDNVEPDAREWRTPTPVPDVSEENQLAIMDLHGDLMARGAVKRFNDMDMRMEVKVPPDLSDDEVEEEAAEIHVEEGEGLKMD